jgi:hypothetical protein
VPINLSPLTIRAEFQNRKVSARDYQSSIEGLLLRKARQASQAGNKPSWQQAVTKLCLLRRCYRVDRAFLPKCDGFGPSPVPSLTVRPAAVPEVR